MSPWMQLVPKSVFCCTIFFSFFRARRLCVSWFVCYWCTGFL